MTSEPPGVDRLRAALERRAHWLAMLAALALVVVVRAGVPYGAVFRDGHVVLVANDPYFYRYWIEQLYGTGLSSVNPFHLGRLPAALRRHDVLFVWAMWPWALLLGGGVRGSGLVLAWYPVVSAVVTALLLYVLAWRLTRDGRVALLSVVVLALTPAHVYRTMLGFGDHHAFDFVALTATATALVWLVTAASERQWSRVDWWVAVAVLGGAVTVQSLAWRGGPILLLPVGVYAAGAAVSGVRADRSPLREHAGLLLGLGLAAAATAVVHLGLGWAPAYRGFAPTLLLALVAGVLLVGEVAVRHEGSWRDAAVGVPVVVAGELLVVAVLAPSLIAPMLRFPAFLDEGGLGRAVEIGEAASLVSGVRTSLLLFGLLLVVAVPVMGWVLVAVGREHRPGLLAVSAYAWVFLGLSVAMVRFSGQLSLFLAVFAAAGLVWLAGRMDVGRRLAPVARRTQVSVLDWPPPADDGPGHSAVLSAGSMLLLVLLVTGVGVAQVPGTMDAVTVDDETYAVARWMDEHAETRGWSYPRSYVFSDWGTSRTYNYHVSGEARTYEFAKGNYREFLASSDATGWYAALEGATGFVVVRPSPFDYPADSMQVRLAERYGSEGDGVAGIAHYRLGYVAGDHSLLVYTLVPGATIVGNATPEATVRVETDVRVGDVSFTYRRSVRADADGRYAVTVPYPGRYAVDGDRVVVTESDVREGETVEASA